MVSLQSPISPYRGRFAPSPTGPLHFGSLIAAVGSYLEARTHEGEWLVRIEDIDRPRCRPEHEHSILRTLERYGFEWDGDVVKQSERTDLYAQALDELKRKGLVFGCACTRKEIGDSLPGIDGAPVYPGTCRNGITEGRAARAWRMRVPDKDVCFEDAVQGRLRQNLARDVGDFILQRADGLFAYQLAVVVDDADQGINHVVRGADLLDSTPRQLFLQQSLNISFPKYAHLPVAVNDAGEKLSKQTLAAPLDDRNQVPALWQALHFLGQHVPEDLLAGTLSDIWNWAITNWSLSYVPNVRMARFNQMEY